MSLLPGLTDTKFAAALTQNPDISKAVLPTIPMGRIAKPEEMAGAVLYLVSDAASYTTGICSLRMAACWHSDDSTKGSSI